MTALDPEFIIGHYNYWVSIALIMIGLYAIFLFYISLGDVEGGVAPLFEKGAAGDGVIYANPLPSAMMLTAIVVTLCMTALALTFAVLIYRRYGTLDARRLMKEI
jgi:multicomponent Na+:H+ antiporter subunit C